MKPIPLLLAIPPLPTLTRDLDFVNNRYVGGAATLAGLLTCTRSGAGATDLMPDSASGASYTTYAANVLRRNANGLLVEATRTNRFINSAAPVTQTVNFNATGTWIVWCNGAGSVTSTTVTATGTGFGVATQGNPNVITITVAGNVLCTCAGALNAVQVELGASGSSFIVTAGAAVVRGAESVTLTDSTPISLTEGTVLCEWQDKNGLAVVGYLWNNQVASTDEMYVRRTSTGACEFHVTAGNVLQAAIVSNSLMANNTLYRSAVSWKVNDCVSVFSKDATVATDSVATMPTGVNTLALGERGSTAQYNGFIRRWAFAPVTAKRAAMLKWAKAI